MLAGRASVRWAIGDQPEARRLAGEAVRIAERCGDDQAIAAAYVAQALAAFTDGDRAGNEHAYARALAAARRAGDVEQQLRIHCNVGSRLIEEGRYRAAVEELDEAVRLGAQTVHPTLLALALINRAEAWLGLCRLEQARADADQAVSLWQQARSPLAAFGHMLTGRVHLARGAMHQAMAAYQAALAVAEPHGNAQASTEAHAGLARIQHADDPAAAARHLELASPGGELAAGWIALCSGDTATALRHADTVRVQAGRRRDPAGLAEALELAALAALAPPRADAGHLEASRRASSSLLEAAGIWAELGNELALAVNAALQARVRGDRLAEEIARERLLQLGVQEGAWHIAGPLAAIGALPAAEVEVRVLGHFEVRLAGVPVPGSRWQSRKARDLLKVLAGLLGRPAPRPALATALWPDVPVPIALRRLSVLISTVRGVLDPGRRYPTDRYLVTDPATVRINPDHAALDSLRFHDAARAVIAADAATAGSDGGGLAAARLEAVLALYPGDFDDTGDLAGDWFERPRTVLAGLHREVVRRLAGRCLLAGRADAAVGWYRRLAEDDRYDEPAHLGLIRALSSAGRHGEAARHYREYVSRMREIDVPPAAFPAAV
ncbi:BTAD domain-containing putative transcriptional regulator [Dactylosporangium sp. CS-033363]|uniref:AfsR/SARP family transcriptional regulator n=1 Tax=Dactylosporangium sp. CS-033363 TaxID=3239935 RepID=UPI003D8D8993